MCPTLAMGSCLRIISRPTVPAVQGELHVADDVCALRSLQGSLIRRRDHGVRYGFRNAYKRVLPFLSTMLNFNFILAVGVGDDLLVASRRTLRLIHHSRTDPLPNTGQPIHSHTHAEYPTTLKGSCFCNSITARGYMQDHPPGVNGTRTHSPCPA